MHVITVSIIEDNRYTMEGCSAILASATDLRVIGMFQSCEEALDRKSTRLNSSH